MIVYVINKCRSVNTRHLRKGQPKLSMYDTLKVVCKLKMLKSLQVQEARQISLGPPGLNQLRLRENTPWSKGVALVSTSAGAQ